MKQPSGQLLPNLHQRFDLLFEIQYPLLQVFDLLTFRVGQHAMIQDAFGCAEPHHAAWDANHGGVIRHRMDDYRTRSDFHVVPNADAAQHLRACSNDHIVADCGVTLALLVSRSAQRHVLVKQYIVPDFRGFADDDAHTVVDKEPTPDLRARVYLDAGQESGELRDDTREERDTGVVELMGEAMEQNGMETRITKEDLQGAFGRWIFPKDGIYLFPDRFEHKRGAR